MSISPAVSCFQQKAAVSVHSKCCSILRSVETIVKGGAFQAVCSRLTSNTTVPSSRHGIGAFRCTSEANSFCCPDFRSNGIHELVRCRVKPRRLRDRRGLHTTTRELQTCTFERPGASNTTKIPREDPPREGRKNEIFGGRKKKSAKFWAPHPSGPTLRAPTFRAPIFSGFGPPPLRALTTRPAHHPTKKKLANCGLAKFGQTKLAKFGLAKCGQIRMAKSGLAKFGRDPSVRPINWSLGQYSESRVASLRCFQSRPVCTSSVPELLIAVRSSKYTTSVPFLLVTLCLLRATPLPTDFATAAALYHALSGGPFHQQTL